MTLQNVWRNWNGSKAEFSLSYSYNIKHFLFILAPFELSFKIETVIVIALWYLVNTNKTQDDSHSVSLIHSLGQIKGLRVGRESTEL